MNEEETHKQNLTRQLYVFTTIGLIASTIYNLYYGIFLYRNSFDIKVLVIDALLVAISSWIGFIVGTFYIHRSGYLKTLRLSFVILFLASITTLMVMESIRDVYPMLSIFRGIPIGIGAAVIDTFLLKEIAHISRSRFLNLNLSIEFGVGVIFPIIIGALITLTHGYEVTFGFAALIYLMAAFLPLRYNKKPKSLINLRSEIEMLKKRGIKEFNLNTALTAGADELNILLIAIVPFLLLGTELEVGIFISAIAIVAAITAFFARNMRYKRQVLLGYYGHVGRLLSNTLLAVVWNPIALVAQGLMNKGLAVFNDPIFKKVRLNNTQKILGKDLGKDALELNLVNSTMELFGQLSALGIFLLVLELSVSAQSNALRYLLILYGVWKLINYLWVLNMGKRFTGYQTQKNLPLS